MPSASSGALSLWAARSAAVRPAIMEGAGASSEALRYAEYARGPTGAGKGQTELDRSLVSALRAGQAAGRHSTELCPHSVVPSGLASAPAKGREGGGSPLSRVRPGGGGGIAVCSRLRRYPCLA